MTRRVGFRGRNVFVARANEIIRRLWGRFWRDRILDRSAILSFYFLLSVFPLLVFLLALVGVVLQSGSGLQDTLQNFLTAVMPLAAYDLIDKTLHEIVRGANGRKLSLGLVFTLWTASRGLIAIMDGMNIAYEVKESRPWWKKNGVALALTLILVSLVAAALLLVVSGARLTERLVITFDWGSWALVVGTLLNWVVALAFVLLAFNILYVYAPNVKHRRWRWWMPGTIAGMLLWFLVSYGFKVYLHFFGLYTVTYGSIGTVIILLLWFYLSGLAVLVGAEVNSEYER